MLYDNFSFNTSSRYIIGKVFKSIENLEITRFLTGFFLNDVSFLAAFVQSGGRVVGWTPNLNMDLLR